MLNQFECPAHFCVPSWPCRLSLALGVLSANVPETCRPVSVKICSVPMKNLPAAGQLQHGGMEDVVRWFPHGV